jgi:predicted amidophosphoribosyltransferase
VTFFLLFVADNQKPSNHFSMFCIDAHPNLDPQKQAAVDGGFCSGCGAAKTAADKFCSGCGNKL